MIYSGNKDHRFSTYLWGWQDAQQEAWRESPEQGSPPRWFRLTGVHYGVEQGGSSQEAWTDTHGKEVFFHSCCWARAGSRWELSSPVSLDTSQAGCLRVSSSTGTPSELAGLPVPAADTHRPFCHHGDWPGAGCGCPLHPDPFMCCNKH